MKKSTLTGLAVVVLGLLIALGPQFLFTACSVHDDSGVPPHCYYSVQAELGIGILIAALGLCFIFLSDQKIRQGLSIGLFFMGIIAFCIPHFLIGGCEIKTMRCHIVSFPPLTIISSVVIAGSILYMFLTERKLKA